MRKPFVVGHRGAAGLEPENTVRSVRRALELGVDAVEIDVRRTRDGKLVVMHDPRVDRTTNGRGRVGDLKLAELRRLDAGKGERIPTLEELVGSLDERVGLFVEIKEPETVTDTLDVLRKAAFVERTTFVSFFHQALSQVKQLSPKSRCGVIFTGEPAHPARLATDVSAEIVVPNHAYITELTVREAHSHSLLVQAWTVNNVDDLARVVRLGVDGVASDYPDIVIAALERETT